MFDRKALKAHFSNAAQGYDMEAALQQMVLRDVMGYAHDYWEAGALIADIGCGTGLLAEEVRRQNFGWQVVGGDIAHGMCCYARGRCPWVVTADAHGLPFADGVFDGALSSLMLQWASQPRDVLAEMARITKKGGYCVVSTFTHGTLVELQQAFLSVDAYEHVSRFLTMEEWRGFALRAGFQVVWLGQKSILEYYPDTVSLMRAIKAIGASHKTEGRRPGLATPRQMKALEGSYRKQFGTRKGLPLSWELLYMVLQA